MKKLLILFLAFGLLTACNNNKTKGDKTDTEKTSKDNTDNKDNKDNKDGNVTDTKTDDDNTGGWPQAKRDEFIGPCVDNAYAASGDRALSESYCECMLNKLVEMYPDVKKAEARGAEGLQADLQPYIDGCAGRK